MTEGKFSTQLNEIERILKSIKVDFDREFHPRYHTWLTAELSSLKYEELWQYLDRQRLFDFRLADGALIQFRRYQGPSDTCYAYAFYECPYKAQTYAGFLEEQGIDVRSVGDEFRPDYEESLENAPLKEAVTPTRYDYMPHSYAEGIHPASHIHIGHASEIRIGTKKLLQPVSFLLFILRQSYPSFWATLLKLPILTRYSNVIRVRLDDISTSYFGPKDEMEMHLL